MTGVEKAEVSSEMPMRGMPVVNQAEAKKTGTPGHYEVEYDFEMKGSWKMIRKV